MSLRTLLTFGLLICAMLLVLGTGGAKAAKFGFSMDRGMIDLGGPDGTWATIVDPDLTPPDDPVKINAEVGDDGALSAGATDFSFPPKRIEGLETGVSLLPVVDANILITAEDALSGNFDSDTGDSTINLPAKVEITVYPAGSPASVAKCKIDGFTLALKTSGSITQSGDPDTVYDAAPFAPVSTPDQPRPGNLLAEWESLPSADAVSGGLAGLVCPELDGMLGGPGGIWLSGAVQEGGIVTPPTKQPIITAKPDSPTESTSAEFTFAKDTTDPVDATGLECSLDQGAFTDCSSGTQTYNGLTDGSHRFDVRATNSAGAGPAATYLWKVQAKTGPPTKPARFGALTVKPKVKKVKRGKKVTVVAKVKNVGGSSAGAVKICVTAPKKLVRVKRCVKKGTLRAGAVATARFKVVVQRKAKRGRKVALKFKATGMKVKAKAGRAVIRVG